MTDLPTVAVWGDDGTQWRVLADLPVYQSCEFEVRHNDTGTWSLTVPWDARSKVVTTESILTFDMRGQRPFSGVISKFERSRDDEGNDVLNLSGLDALAYLGYSLAWPHPGSAITSQTAWDPSAAAPINTNAADAVRQVIRDNVINRRSLRVALGAGAGLGTTVRIRPAFDNLLELVLRKASRGGIGVRTEMVAAGSSDGTFGTLTVRTYVPTDRSVRVVFSDQDGSAATWTRSRTAPTASNVVVSGVQVGQYRRVGRNATGWNPTREQLVQGPDSWDDTELDQAADEALDAGEPQVNVEVTAAETPGTLAFRDYNVGDTATAILGAETLVDTITAIGVKADGDGVVVTPRFGDPDGIDPRDAQAKLLRSARRDIDKQKRRT